MAKQKKNREQQRADRKAARQEKRDSRGGGTDFAGLAGGVLGAVGTFGPMVQDIGMDADARMDKTGDVTHDPDIGGKTMGGAQAGVEIGSAFGPVGALIGGAGGALLGLGAGLIDKGNQPTLAEQMQTNNEFNMQQQVAGIQANDTLPVQAPAAKNGLNDITGMKKIEVEKDEIVLRKSGNAFQKVADFKGGKTHGQGGEPYVAAEGDVIFPGKKRLAVNKALRTRDWRGLESMRMQLPKDTPESRKANGVDEVLTDPIDGKVPLKSIAGKPVQPAVHIPVKPGKAGDLLDTQAHYAKTKSLSNEQLEGMKAQQLDHRAYEGRKKDFQRDYLHKWRANPANEKYTALSPEYQTVMAEGKKAWFDENPRMVNKTVADYRDTGGQSPAGLHYAKGEYAEGTAGIETEPVETPTNSTWTPEMVQTYIDKYSKGEAPITGQELLDLANENDFPIELALIQGRQESQFGTVGAGTYTKNIYNWGNFTAGDTKTREQALKDGDRKVMDSVLTGVTKYMKGVKANYLNPVGGDWKKLLEEDSFRNASGNRYATHTEYEANLSSFAKDLEDTKKALPPAKPAFVTPSMLPEDMPKNAVPATERKSTDILPGVSPNNSILRPDVQEELAEDAKGYYSASTITGRKVLRGLKDKMDKAETADALNRNTSGGILDRIASSLSIGLGGGPLGASPGGLMGHQATSRAVGEAFGLERILGDKPAQISGFKKTPTGDKLKREAKAFYDFLKHEAEGDAGTYLVGDAFRAFDSRRAKIFGADDTLSYKIADALSGVPAEAVEEAMKQAKNQGYISQLGEDYLWDVTANSGDFKSLQTGVGEQIDLASVADPRAWAGLAKLSVKTAKGAKSLVKSGAVLTTKKGRRALNIKRITNKRLKAAKNNEAQAGKLDEQLSSMYKQYEGQEGIDELLAMQNKVAEKVGDANILPRWTQVVEAAKAVGEQLKAVPDKFRKAFVGRSFTEVSKMNAELMALTGKTRKEINAMSKPELGKLLQGKIDVVAENVSRLAKEKNVAMDNYGKAKEAHIALEAELDAVKAGKADPIEVVRLEKEIQGTRSALKDNAKRVKETITAQEDALEEVLKVEDFMASDEYGDKFRTVMKLEDDWQRKMAKVDKADVHLGDLAVEQEALVKSRNALAADKVVEGKSAITGYAKEVAEAKKARTEALSSQQSAVAKLNQAEGRAPGDVAKIKADLEKFPKLAKAFADDAELVEMWSQAGKGSIKIAKVLDLAYEKYGGDLEPREDIDKTITPEVVKEDEGKGRDVKPSVLPEDAKEVQKAESVLDNDLKEEDVKREVTKRIGDGTVPEKGPSTLKKIGGELSSLAAYAPAVYNIVKGLGSADKVDRRYVRPQTRKYENMSQPQMSAIDEAFSAAMGNARNTSGGLMANFRANTEQAWADKIARKGAVNAQEVQRSDQIAAQNIGIRNQAKAQNVAMNQKADIMDAQAQAATDSFLAQGMADVANIGAVKRKDKAAKENQEYMLKLMGEGSKYDPVTGAFRGGTTGRGTTTATTTTEPIAEPAVITPADVTQFVPPEEEVLPEWSLDFSETQADLDKFKNN